MTSNIGKRVIVNGVCSGINLKNAKGTIIEDNISDYGIKFDEPNERLWEVDGEDRGWYVKTNNVKFVKENKRMTGIQISTEKIVESDGTLSRKITGFKALASGKLPKKYLEGERPICFLKNGNLYVSNRAEDFYHGYFRVFEIVTEDDFQKLLDHCHKAGDHLMDVNRELAEKRTEWHGKETFVI